MTQAFPLQWPGGWPRAKWRENDGRFHGRGFTMGRVRDDLINELRLLGATGIVVSSNVPVKADGLLYADNKRLDDPGIAVYFKFKNKQMVMARDGFVSVTGNLRSLALAIEGLRQLERHGGSVMLERAFEGFLAIAPPGWMKPWSEVFGVKGDWAGDIADLYREKARTRHTDAGGSDTLMAELNVAYKQARLELGK
jgi:hypothetical protein